MLNPVNRKKAHLTNSDRMIRLGDVMEIARTVKIKINLPREAAVRTLNTWTEACNLVSRIAFENGCLSNAIRLQKLAYRPAKEVGLSAQLAGSCIRHVASEYVAIRSNKRSPKAPCQFRKQAVILQGGTRGRDVSLRASGLSIWTVDGRFKAVPFQGPPDLEDKLNNWNLGDGRLSVSRKHVFLTLSFKKEVEPRTAPNDAVIGVDRGINVLACATDGKRHWMRKGGHTKHLRDRYSNVRASLQKRKAEHPTRSVAKVLKRLSGREARFMRAVNHEVSKAVVTFAERTGCPVIAIEDLEGIRNRRLRKVQRREIGRWAYGQLRKFITYKAEGLGMVVVGIDPRYTSQGCSRCGHTEASNRQGNLFLCKACGHSLHADLNAAHNIRLRGILARQALSEDGASHAPPKFAPTIRSGKPGRRRTSRQL